MISAALAHLPEAAASRREMAGILGKVMAATAESIQWCIVQLGWLHCHWVQMDCQHTDMTGYPASIVLSRLTSVRYLVPLNTTVRFEFLTARVEMVEHKEFG
jgi:hypothetical protein